MLIHILLHKDRTLPGTLNVIDGQTTRLTVPCLGKSDNMAAKAHRNPTRDPAGPYGDTPVGSYGLVWLPWRPTGDKNADEEHVSGYGPFGMFAMVPDFTTVRVGLMIHAGDAGKQYGGLRPTYGCVRVSNESMALLVKLLTQTTPVQNIPRRWSCIVEEIPETIAA